MISEDIHCALLKEIHRIISTGVSAETSEVTGKFSYDSWRLFLFDYSLEDYLEESLKDYRKESLKDFLKENLKDVV